MEDKGPKIQETIEEKPAQKPSRNWWQILQLLGAYLVAAWTLLQFVDWIFTRNQISPYWVDFFLWIFIGLLPSFLYYLFHKDRIDSGQIKKRDKALVFINLLLLIIVLVVGFRSADMGATTKEIQYASADGRVLNSTIVKQEFRKTIGLFDFEAEQVDSSNLWLGSVLRILLRYDIQQDKAINIYDTGGDIPMATKINKSRDFFVDGHYNHVNGKYTITPKFHLSKNGKLKASKSFVGDDLLSLVDSISIFIRKEAGISDDLIEATTDLPVKEFTSSSLEAIQYFCEGHLPGMERAIAIDSTFALASLEMGKGLFYRDLSELDAKFYFNQAFRHRYKLPFYLQYSVLSYRQIIYNDLKAAEETLLLQLEIDPDNSVLKEDLIRVYQLSRKYEDILAFTEKWFEKDPFPAAEDYANALLINGLPDVLLKKAKPFLALFPNDESILEYIFKAHMINQNWESALDIIQKIKLIRPDFRTQVDSIEKSILYQRDQGMEPGEYEAFLSIFRQFFSERMATCFKHPTKDHLLVAQVHGSFGLFFPLNEEKVVSISNWEEIEIIGLSRDSTGQVIGFEVKELRGSKPDEFNDFFWKIDSLILKAESLLKEKNYSKAEAAYEKAIKANPNHYFLQDGLAHIQFVKSKTAKKLEEQYQSVAGSYGDRNFWVENGSLYYKRNPLPNRYFPKMELFPISDTRYMNLTRQHLNMVFEYEKGKSTACYTYIYNRDSLTWRKNGLEEDYKMKD